MIGSDRTSEAFPSGVSAVRLNRWAGPTGGLSVPDGTEVVPSDLRLLRFVPFDLMHNWDGPSVTCAFGYDILTDAPESDSRIAS